MELAETLSPVDAGAAAYIRSCTSKTPQQIADDLSLWGGSGSLVDQAHTHDPVGLRHSFETALIALAFAVIAAGARNPRVEWWASKSAPAQAKP